MGFDRRKLEMNDAVKKKTSHADQGGSQKLRPSTPHFAASGAAFGRRYC
jgi:hypothetical protein